MGLQVPSSVPPTQPFNRNNTFRTFGLSYIPTTTLPGFYVGSDDDIAARDVPNDGSISFFPSKDLSHITIKQWNGNTLESAVYVLAQNKQQIQQSQNPPLPAPPPPVNQKQQDQTFLKEEHGDHNIADLLEGFKQMNNGMANAFGQMGDTLTSIRENLEKLNNRFMDEGGMG